MSTFERLWRRLLLPAPSRALCALASEGAILFDRRTRQSHFEPWVEQAFQPAFDKENVGQVEAFATTLTQAAQALGIAGERRWSVLLPGETARTYVITVEATVPPHDVPEVLLWKAERLTGLPSNELWMTAKELGTGLTGAGAPGRRFLLITMSRCVALALQAHLEQLHWQPGLLLPRLVCEALWLRRTSGQNQMLVRVESDVLSVMLLQQGVPIALRTLPLAGELLSEQLLRVLLFFREHAVESGLGSAPEQIHFEVLPVNVPLEAAEVSQCIRETFGNEPHIIEPQHLGFSSAVEFARLAGLTGLVWATA